MEAAVPGNAAQVIIAIIPIVGIVIGGIVMFFFLLWRHSETNLQIKLGAYHRERFNLALYTLLFGIMLSGVGGVLTVFFALFSGRSLALLGGLLPLSIGVCLIIFYNLYVKLEKRDTE